jgi:DNA modification methylase
MLKHIHEVLCSSYEDAYQFLLKWFANMVRGDKNDSCIYLKGSQGRWKSTPIEFIRDHVIGKDLCTQCGSAPLKSKFNSELSGKLMVMLEELENFSINEWISVSAVLKRQITSNTIMIEAKGVNAREETNINKYILLSNNDSIQDDEGRRYNILVSPTSVFIQLDQTMLHQAEGN